jgi:hypothetical protein
MGFAILRVAKLTTGGNIGGLNSHITRTMDVPNADPDLAHLNSRPVGSDDLWHDVKQRIDQSGVKQRKNAVLAVEHLITASPETFGFEVKETEGKKGLYGNVKAWENFEAAAKKWLINRYGQENLVNFTVHHDESTPHIHAVVVPILDGKLNCRAYLGGREKLSKMQTEFAQAVEHIGLQRGIKGSKAKHMEAKQFNGIVEESKKAIKAIQDTSYTAGPLTLRGFQIPDPPLTNRSKWKEGVQSAMNEHIKQMLEDLRAHYKKELEKKTKAIKENANKSILSDYNGVLEKRERKGLLERENALKAKYEGKNTILEGMVKKLQDALNGLGFKYNPKIDAAEPVAGQQEQKQENRPRMRW